LLPYLRLMNITILLYPKVRFHERKIFLRALNKSLQNFAFLDRDLTHT
jgi:hypothetical protein